MGKKISWENAEKLASLENKNKSIFMIPNKYGFRVNINHSKIRPIYENWKHKNGILIPSDKERREFENSLINYINEKRRKL